jgi:peptide/nickel transport system ATP-binding protein
MTPFLSLEHITKNFVPPVRLSDRLMQWTGRTTPSRIVQAVSDVSLNIGEGEVVGLVGESGCGKSTLARIATGLMSPSEGKVFVQGQDRDQFDPEARKKSQISIQMIFQDPMSSLNPRMRVLDLIGEAPLKHNLIQSQHKRDYVAEMLDLVGLDPAVMQRFAHEFSGGQRARIAIARALAVRPKMLICDEAVASLDISIQAQILNLFMKLREDLKLTYLFVSHDLSVVRHIADRVAVMYLGRMVELAPNEALFEQTNHPYTLGLLAEVPSLDVRHKKFGAIKGEIPSPLNPPSGCHFHTRCTKNQSICQQEIPPLKQICENHYSACHLNN